jgi:hypothetical protein
MATASPSVSLPRVESRALRTGSALMLLAAVGFIGYAVIFFVRNFTDSFLELGIGSSEVSVGRDEILEFSPSLYHYIGHLHIAVSGFIAATGVAVIFLVWFGGAARPHMGVGRGRCGAGTGTGGRTPRALPE